MGIHPDRWGFLPGFLLESTRVQTGNYTDKTSKKPFFQPGKFCKHSVWISKRSLGSTPIPRLFGAHGRAKEKTQQGGTRAVK